MIAIKQGSKGAVLRTPSEAHQSGSYAVAGNCSWLRLFAVFYYGSNARVRVEKGLRAQHDPKSKMQRGIKGANRNENSDTN